MMNIKVRLNYFLFIYLCDGTIKNTNLTKVKVTLAAINQYKCINTIKLLQYNIIK